MLLGWMLLCLSFGLTWRNKAHGQPQVLGMFGWSLALQTVAACQDAWVWSDNGGFKPPELLQGLKRPLT